MNELILNTHRTWPSLEKTKPENWTVPTHEIHLPPRGSRMQAGLELRTTTQQYTWMRWKDGHHTVTADDAQMDSDDF